MPKVTITIESDNEMTQITREDREIRVALASCLLRVDDQYPQAALERIAEAARLELHG